MKQYRKKPVVVDAIEISTILRFATKDWARLPQWVKDKYESGDIVFLPNGVSVHTLEGSMFGFREDMLIKGVEGEIYPCRRGIFDITYEEVKDERTRDSYSQPKTSS